MERRASDEVAREVSDIVDLIQSATHEVRSLTFEISPPLLYEMGLEAAAEWLVNRLNGEYGGIFAFEDDGKPKPLSDLARGVVYQGLRELLMNVVEHSQATSATVSLSREGRHLRLVVRDDGCGFDPEETAPDMRTFENYGLFCVREQLESVGGHVLIVSEPGAGTSVTVIAPLSDPGGAA